MRTCRSAVAIPNVSPFVATFSDIIRRHAVMRRIGPVQPTSPEALLLSEFTTVERVIAFVTARRRLRPADAEEFASHVKMKLIENDYAVLRKFEGRSSLRTHLTVARQRLRSGSARASVVLHGRSANNPDPGPRRRDVDRSDRVVVRRLPVYAARPDERRRDDSTEHAVGRAFRQQADRVEDGID